MEHKKRISATPCPTSNVKLLWKDPYPLPIFKP